MGRRQQSESIAVALNIYGVRSFDGTFWHCSVPIFVKCRITCLLNPPIAIIRKNIVLTRINFRYSGVFGPDKDFIEQSKRI